MRLRLNRLGLALGVGLALAHVAGAQQTTPPPDTAPAPQATPAPQTPPATAPPAPQAQPGTVKTAKEPLDPSRTDQLFALEFDYWLANGLPTLKGGNSFDISDGSTLVYPGSSTYALAGQVVVPLPARSDIRISGFEVHGNGTTTLTSNNAYYSTGFNTGDFLSPSYTLHNLRISYEYLSLPWPPETKKWKLYTLYELQYTNIKTTIDAPLKASVDVNGNPVQTTAQGSEFIVYPTFGLKLEYPVSQSFRLEMEASGFGIPHHAGQWNADVTGAYRIHNHFEIRGGFKTFYYKTSPGAAEYFSQTVWGAYVGVRYYLRPIGKF